MKHRACNPPYRSSALPRAYINDHTRGKLAKVDDGTPAMLVDDRAGSKSLMLYPPLCRVGELCRLESADVAIVGNGPKGIASVGVEVKSITDLISSIETGRLQGTQIPEMMQTYDVVWLLYYGEYRPGASSGGLEIQTNNGTWRQYSVGKREIPWGWLESMLLTVSAAGVRVKWVGGSTSKTANGGCEGLRRAAYWCGALARWYNKEWDKHRGFHTFDHSQRVSLPPGERRENKELLMRARVVSGIPSLGYERAIAAAKHFPGIIAMITASEEEWREVPGIGKTLSKAVVQWIHGGQR
jgi:ERCC4-type nuclease